jgi:DNA polymerase-3 subunit epsilon
MREIVFDTETTGFDPKSGDRMVEIGCIELIDRIETGRTYHAYFNPCRPMPPGAEAIHGLGDAFLANKPKFSEKVAELLDFLGDAKLVAHNAPFDFGFLNAELGQCGQRAVCLTRMIDTIAIARTLHPGAKHSLDALCTRYGIDRSHRVKHGALLDAELLTQLYIELTGGRQIGFDIGVAAVPGSAGQPSARAPARPYRAPRAFAASAEELARHAAFVARIDGSLWNVDAA